MVEQIKANQLGTATPDLAFQDLKILRSESQKQPIESKDKTPSGREEVPREEVEKAIDRLNRMMGIIEKRYEFKIHEKAKRVMVRVIDQETGDVINEIPPKKLLDFLGSFREWVGLLIDKHV